MRRIFLSIFRLYWGEWRIDLQQNRSLYGISPNLHYLCRSHRSLEKSNHLPGVAPGSVQEVTKTQAHYLGKRGSWFRNMATAQWKKGKSHQDGQDKHAFLSLFTVTVTCLESTLDLEVSIISLLQNHGPKEKFCLGWHLNLACITVFLIDS